MTCFWFYHECTLYMHDNYDNWPMCHCLYINLEITYCNYNLVVAFAAKFSWAKPFQHCSFNPQLFIITFNWFVLPKLINWNYQLAFIVINHYHLLFQCVVCCFNKTYSGTAYIVSFQPYLVSRSQKWYIRSIDTNVRELMKSIV